MVNVILALMLSAFATRRMVRSAHLAHPPIRFTAQLDFDVSYRYSYEKIHSASIVHTAKWFDLSTRHHIKLLPEGLMW